MDINRKIEVAKGRAVMDQPFFAHLMLGMDIKERNDIPTFATDGRCIYYNKEFADSITVDEIEFVLLHEVMHPAFFHLTRMGDRDPTIWNIAGDYVINHQLISAGLKGPKDILVSDEYDHSWSTDRVYEDLIQNTSSFSVDLPDISTGEFESVDSVSGDNQTLESEWKVKIISAANSCKQRGEIPASFQDIIDEIRKPKVDWRSQLYSLATEPMVAEQTWAHPNRRFVSEDLYLPSLRNKNGIRKIVFVVDTSGSMDKEILSQAWSEVVSVAKDCDVGELIVLDVDAQVQAVRRFDASDIPNLIEVKGRGGTAFEPAFDWVIENDEDPAVLIYLTDMYGSFPQYEPDYPVIWVNYGGKDAEHHAPFGEVINVD